MRIVTIHVETLIDDDTCQVRYRVEDDGGELEIEYLDTADDVSQEITYRTDHYLYHARYGCDVQVE